ncbi:50S ribosomal protein L10 [Candidatus Woesearchaeota archaeon]|nr:MAG: 50S ribosomal protein L10 [Candidatus Woesearchaeota archaeon]
MKAAKIQPRKKQAIEDLVAKIEAYPIIGVVNLQNLPAKQLQTMKEKLRGTVEMRMSKKTLIRLAFKQAKKEGIDQLSTYLRGMPALIFTKENPFSLFRTLKKSQSSAPIKAGQTAPADIVVPAGPTSFAPGPIIGELGAFGIKTGVENGKIAIKADAVVAKEGEEVSEKLAGILARLGIEPMKIGLDLIAVYEEGEIITKDTLDIDEEAYQRDFAAAASESFNLAMFIHYPTKETIRLFLTTAAAESLALAREANIITKDTIKDVLAKAHRQVAAIQAKTG